MTALAPPRASTTSASPSPTLRDAPASESAAPTPRASLAQPKPRAQHTPGEEADRAERQARDEGADEPADPPPKTEDGRGGPPPPDADADDPDKVAWDGPDDPANPQNWSAAKKWRLTILVSAITVAVTFASSAPSYAVEAFQKDFGESAEVSYLILSLFLAGFITGPFLWAPGSEMIGRRPIFVGTLAALTLFQLGEALAPDTATLMVCRFFSGAFAASPLTNAGGVIADIWDPVGRGPAMSIFSASAFIGPIIGPFIGGFLSTSSKYGWRWIFWIIMALSGLVTVVVFFLLPETFSPVLLMHKAKRLRKEDPERNGRLYAEHEKLDNSPRSLFHRTVWRPFHMMLVEPMLVVVTIYLSIVYACLYGLFEAFPIIWGPPVRPAFTPGLSGLIFVGVGIGTTAGAAINIWLSREYGPLTVKWRGHPPPEPRLKGSMFAGPFFCVGIFFLGWTGAFASVPWWVPALATIIIGVSFTLIFISFLTYIVDVYVMYAASALAANTITRSALAAAFPLFTVQMFEGLGTQWACTLLGCIGLVLLPSPFLFYKFGPRLRQRSQYAPCPDLKVKQEIEDEEKRAAEGSSGQA